jgi:hypothetical protein
MRVRLIGLLQEVPMTRPLRLGLAAAVLAAASSGAAFAHHNSMEGYDASAPVILAGEITKIDWVNPHVQVHIRTKDGKAWKVQVAPMKAMRENGLDEAAFGSNEQVTIRGYQSKDRICKPECLATGRDVIFADGLKVLLDGTHAKAAASTVRAKRVAARAKLSL